MQDFIMRLAATPATTTSAVPTVTIPSFTPFESTSELWKGYWARFNTSVGANSIPKKVAQVFLTNQTTTVYKLLNSLAGQQMLSEDINKPTMEEIAAFMEGQFDHSNSSSKRDSSSGWTRNASLVRQFRR